MVTHIQAKDFAGTRGGGVEMIFQKCFLISIYFNVKLLVLPKNFISLKHLIWKIENGFHCHKVLRIG